MDIDGVDRIRQQWASERPALDTQAMAILGRINRIAGIVGATMKHTFSRHGLSGADFDVLATLRRSGAPYRLSPRALSDALMLTSGGMTGRLDRLEQAGLVERSPHPDDRRSVVVTLTTQGQQVVEGALDDVVDAQQRLLAAIPPDRREQLEDLLREMLAAVTHTASLPPGSMDAR